MTAVSAGVVELLHWTPYQDGGGVLFFLAHGFVVDIQLVVVFHDDGPLVDRYTTFKLYFSRKYVVV